VRQIIENHRIYFARSSELNDPFDLAPVLYLDKTLSEPDLREKLIADATRNWARNEPGLPQEEIERRYAWLRTCDLRQFEHDSRAKVFQRLENCWVFSLAGNRDHPMLWSHYADSHKGLCIHLSTANSMFGASQRVQYVPERPRVTFPFVTSSKELLDTCVLRKGKFWEYEEEYRIIRYPDMTYYDLGLNFDGQLATYQAHLLTGITVGARMPDADIQAVLEMAARHRPALPVWRAHETLAYGFDFDKLT
jgi:hypothetical protein